MYNVHMKRYPVAIVRERLAEALDAAHDGVPVVIVRRGVHYRLTRETQAPTKRQPRRQPLFSDVDPAILAGDWSWKWSPEGMTFVAARKK